MEPSQLNIDWNLTIPNLAKDDRTLKFKFLLLREE